jgi:cell wall-associated NlpC family hydrolase
MPARPLFHRRATRPVTVVCAVALLLSPCLAANADTPNPSAQQLKAAHQKVATAKRAVQTLQARAEAAAEAYLGAVTRAHRSALDAQVAKVHASEALTRYQTASVASDAAQAAAQTATGQANAALAAQVAAQQAAADAQTTLDRIASGAFQSGGQLGMLSQLMIAKDPLELANGRKLMNDVGAYQRDVIRELHTAKQAATSAAEEATTAQVASVDAAKQAATSLATATEAKSQADSARADASAAASTAHRRLLETSSAKKHAQQLVNQAEAALGGAVRTAASLEASARAARRAASHVVSGKAPSDAAQTAIHWAFQEIGIPYSWGGGDENGPTYGFAQGAGTKGFDCSGLTLFAYGKTGIHLDHYTGSQWGQGKRISSRSDLLPGDLMFFAYDTSDPSTIHHVAIYIGNGKMIEAPQTGDVVKVSPYGRDDFIGGTRPWQT